MNNNNSEHIEDILEHAGILGMRWGRRKGRSSSSSVSTASKDHQRARELKKKKLKELSNDEITSITTRIQLEKNFKSLNPTKKQKVASYLKDVGSKYGNQVVSNLVTQAANKSSLNIMNAVLSTKKK